MANKTVFRSAANRAPIANVTNEAGGRAYSLPPKTALGVLACTGCINGTYYVDAETQLSDVVALAQACNDPAYVARVAIYAREEGRMKDMPALLISWLSLQAGLSDALFQRAWSRCIDNGKQVSNVVQILRSGVLGRKSLPHRVRRAVRSWLKGMTPERTLFASVGYTAPSFADLLRMVRPKPEGPRTAALYGWISGRNPKEKPIDSALLPQGLQDFEKWKTERGTTIPEVPWSMLTSLELKAADWAALVPVLSWQTIRMNLNTMLRQKALDEKGVTEAIVARLTDEAAIRKARPMPYQLLAAYKHVSDEMPRKITGALHDAMEIATRNVPKIEGGASVFVDCSGSMNSPVTGNRGTASTKILCTDVAGLIAAALVRSNEDTEVIAFATSAVHVRVEPRDSVLTTAQKVSKATSGGTACAVALELANRLGLKSKVCIYVSDNESWMDPTHAVLGSANDSTRTAQEWVKYRNRVKGAVLVNINLQPYKTAQVQGASDVLNVGGFSDAVFDLIAMAARGGLTATSWEEKIAALEL